MSVTISLIKEKIVMNLCITFINLSTAFTKRRHDSNFIHLGFRFYIVFHFPLIFYLMNFFPLWIYTPLTGRDTFIP